MEWNHLVESLQQSELSCSPRSLIRSLFKPIFYYLYTGIPGILNVYFTRIRMNEEILALCIHLCKYFTILSKNLSSLSLSDLSLSVFQSVSNFYIGT
jgi:hypothetical protein